MGLRYVISSLDPAIVGAIVGNYIGQYFNESK